MIVNYAPLYLAVSFNINDNASLFRANGKPCPPCTDFLNPRPRNLDRTDQHFAHEFHIPTRKLTHNNQPKSRTDDPSTPRACQIQADQNHAIFIRIVRIVAPWDVHAERSTVQSHPHLTCGRDFEAQVGVYTSTVRRSNLPFGIPNPRG